MESGSKFVVCKKCNQLMKYEETETWWDESGYCYSTKLVECKTCGTPIVLKYEEDSWIAENEC